MTSYFIVEASIVSRLVLIAFRTNDNVIYSMTVKYSETTGCYQTNADRGDFYYDYYLFGKNGRVENTWIFRTLEVMNVYRYYHRFVRVNRNEIGDLLVLSENS